MKSTQTPCAIITGASRGIGQSTAALFLEKGYDVINLARTPCSLPNIINHTTELSHPETFKKLALFLKEKIKAKKKICLVHNAMTSSRDNIRTLAAQHLRNVLELGIVAPLELNQICLPLMAANSSIIYIGSTLSEKAVPNAAAYVIQKHATVGLMRSTCQDLAGMDIHTACVCPGFTDTAMLREHVSPEILQQLADRVAAKRLLAPEEIAKLIYFCAENPAINGSVIHAHLGQIES